MRRVCNRQPRSNSCKVWLCPQQNTGVTAAAVVQVAPGGCDGGLQQKRPLLACQHRGRVCNRARAARLRWQAVMLAHVLSCAVCQLLARLARRWLLPWNADLASPLCRTRRRV